MFVCAVFRVHQTEDMTAGLTVIAHHHYIHGYFENDKLLFSLLLALEVHVNYISLVLLCQFICVFSS